MRLLIGVVLWRGAFAAATPLRTIDLASDTAWACRGEQDADWSPHAVPGAVRLGKARHRWIDFRRTIDVPAVAAGQVTVVRLLSINDGGEVFVDGRSAGVIDYGLFPAEIDISARVTPGRSATLTLRAYSRVNFYAGGHFPTDNNGQQLLGVAQGSGPLSLFE